MMVVDLLAVGRWELETPEIPGVDKLTFTTWDFAGQELYYSTHQFFISSRALYLIVFRVTDPPEQWKIDYWLQSVQSRVKGAPIIIVGTHAEGRYCSSDFYDDVYNRITEKCRAHSNNVKGEPLTNYSVSLPPLALARLNWSCLVFSLGIYMVSSLSGFGVDELRAALVQIVSKERYMNEEIPQNYMALEERVSAVRTTRTPPVMTWSEFQRYLWCCCCCC